MKQYLCIFLVLGWFFADLTAQEAAPVIEIRKEFGTKYFYNGKQLEGRDNLLTVFKKHTHKAAIKKLKGSKFLIFTGSFITTLGCGLMAFPIGYLLPTRQFLLPLFLSGVGTTSLGLMMVGISLGKVRRSVRIFNTQPATAEEPKAMLIPLFGPTYAHLVFVTRF